MAKKKAPQKDGSSRSQAAVGKRNSNVGKEMERVVVRDLQAILEPDLHRMMEGAREMLKIPADTTKENARKIRSSWTKTLRELQKKSKIRRGEQGRGAHEPDVVSPTKWWIEVGRRSKDDILRKLDQAIEDARSAVRARKDPPWLRPVAIVRKTGSPQIYAAMYLGALLSAADPSEEVAWMLDSWTWDIPIVLEYERFLDLVRWEHAG